MTSLEIWSYIFGGATIFAFVVGIFSAWNGRMTRRELTKTITEVTERSEARTQSMLNRMDEHTKQMEERHRDYFEKILEKVS